MFPWSNIKLTSLVNIRILDEQDIPEEAGAYVMLSDNTAYTYPWSKSLGKSKVFYIGQSNNLRNRLKIHKKHSTEAKDNPDPAYDYYWPRYEYAAHHGCNVCWITCEGEKEAKEIEKNLMLAFSTYYGARPVANGQSAWH